MKRYQWILIYLITAGILFFIFREDDNIESPVIPEEMPEISPEHAHTIYLAGGCFWGVEGYFQRLKGVGDTEVGYANGLTEETSYRQLGKTEHAETVKIIYDDSKISLEEILAHYFRIIDPTSVDRQGNDRGRQYRTGIYYVEEEDLPVIERTMDFQREKHGTLAVEVEPLEHFISAEEGHQDYLIKHPGGYCHVDLNLVEEPLTSEELLPEDKK